MIFCEFSYWFCIARYLLFAPFARIRSTACIPCKCVLCWPAGRAALRRLTMPLHPIITFRNACGAVRALPEFQTLKNSILATGVVFWRRRHGHRNLWTDHALDRFHDYNCEAVQPPCHRWACRRAAGSSPRYPRNKRRGERGKGKGPRASMDVVVHSRCKTTLWVWIPAENRELLLLT